MAIIFVIFKKFPNHKKQINLCLKTPLYPELLFLLIDPDYKNQYHLFKSHIHTSLILMARDLSLKMYGHESQSDKPKE